MKRIQTVNKINRYYYIYILLPKGVAFAWAASLTLFCKGGTFMITNLNERQLKFVDYFLQTGNAAEAARRAGYSEKYAGQNADKLLKNKDIAEYLKKRSQDINADRIADLQEILTHVTEILRGEIGERITIHEKQKGKRTVTQEIRKSATLKDRLKAAEILLKRFDITGNDDKIEIVNFCFEREILDDTEKSNAE